MATPARTQEKVQNITTKQELVNAFAAHLRKQGAPSVSEKGHCMYRGNNGTSCGFGGLILDQHYRPEIENMPVSDVDVSNALVQSGVHLVKIFPVSRLDSWPFLSQLQSCHDVPARAGEDLVEFLSRFEVRLSQFCRDYGLTYPSPKEKS